jgi:hypothetical protein
VDSLTVLRDGFDKPLESTEHLDLRFIKSRMRLTLEEAADLIRSVLDIVVVLHQNRSIVSDSGGEVVDGTVVVLDVAHAHI